LARKKAEEEALARKKAEEEELARKKAEEEDLARKKAEEEELARKKAEEEELARKRAEEEALARRKAEEAELARQKAEEERLAAKLAEEELLKQEMEKVRLEAELVRKQAEEELARKAMEETQRLAELEAKTLANAKATLEGVNKEMIDVVVDKIPVVEPDVVVEKVAAACAAAVNHSAPSTVTEVIVDKKDSESTKEGDQPSAAVIAGNYAKELAEETSNVMEEIIQKNDKVEMEMIGSEQQTLTKKQSRLKKLFTLFQCNIL